MIDFTSTSNTINPRKQIENSLKSQVDLGKVSADSLMVSKSQLATLNGVYTANQQLVKANQDLGVKFDKAVSLLSDLPGKIAANQPRPPETNRKTR